jgi:hypothetical protein
MTVRAKFYCSTVEQASSSPVETMAYVDGKLQPSGEFSWPRTFRFNAQYDMSVPEDQRYAKASPSGELRIQVDNPAVEFVPGRSYYLDFTEVEDTTPAE